MVLPGAGRTGDDAEAALMGVHAEVFEDVFLSLEKGVFVEGEGGGGGGGGGGGRAMPKWGLDNHDWLVVVTDSWFLVWGFLES